MNSGERKLIYDVWNDASRTRRILSGVTYVRTPHKDSRVYEFLTSDGRQVFAPETVFVEEVGSIPKWKSFNYDPPAPTGRILLKTPKGQVLCRYRDGLIGSGWAPLDNYSDDAGPIYNQESLDRCEWSRVPEWYNIPKEDRIEHK